MKALRSLMLAYIKPFIRILLLTTGIGFVLRLFLILNGQTLSTFSVINYLRIFIYGFVNDVCVAFIGTLFIFINLIFISSDKYRKPWRYIIPGIFVLGLVYLLFFDKTIGQFNKPLMHIICWILLYKCVSFGLRAFIPKIRKNYSLIMYGITIFVYVCVILINTIGEYFFWNEFGVRYNFIAVDYLVYTNEVIGNILESYPIVPIFSVIGVLSLALTYWIGQEKWEFVLPSILKIKEKLWVVSVYTLFFCMSCVVVTEMAKLQTNKNVYVNELQANGLYKFYRAFFDNELDYDRFYLTLPKSEAIDILNKEYDSKGADNYSMVMDSLPEMHKNIVLIMVESLSAEYLSEFGNKDHITPNLDAILNKSLSFEDLYANGNRTVRGLEAVTLSIPPSPGESIIKRKNNSHLYSVATVLKQKGYKVQFLYGGDSYFDNMKTFFSGNGYEVIDKKDMKSGEVTFSTVWGACDENLFSKALKVFDKDAVSGKPFFAHIMTTSNHRPYLYPENKIDISPKKKSRKGGVKYTDYAIGRFLNEASKKPWFKNTVFVIVADHCASSAGSTEVPLNKYHIPALIYAPGFVKPQKINCIASQMDIMPTVFGLLHFSYRSEFYGRNVLSPEYKPRAVVATYQDLGYLRNHIFTILSSPHHVMQFKTVPQMNYEYKLVQMNTMDEKYVKEAIANYQSIGYRRTTR